jgi:cytochrome c oxidase accessory protein FixG
LTDADALNVTYRFDRGEPRASVKQAAQLKAAGEPAGDCVECKQCIAVCPTGIDIRDGTQLGCIQCGLCIDACDDVMGKVGRPTGLIGYDTLQAVEARACGSKPPAVRIIRPRTLLYAAIIAIVGGAMLYQLATRSFLNLAVVHERTPLFTLLKDGSIRNAYTLRIANKRSEERPVAITLDAPMGTTWEVAGAQQTADWRPIVVVPPDTTLEVKMFVTMPKPQAQGPSQMIQIKAADLSFGENAIVKDNFFAP